MGWMSFLTSLAPWQQDGEDREGDHGQEAVAEDAVAAVQVARDAVLGGVARNVLGDEPQRERRENAPAQDDAEVHLSAPLRPMRQQLSDLTWSRTPRLCRDAARRPTRSTHTKTAKGALTAAGAQPTYGAAEPQRCSAAIRHVSLRDRSRMVSATMLHTGNQQSNERTNVFDAPRLAFDRTEHFCERSAAHQEVREPQDGGEQQRAADVQLLHLRRAHLEGQHTARPLPDAAQIDAKLCAGRRGAR